MTCPSLTGLPTALSHTFRGFCLAPIGDGIVVIKLGLVKEVSSTNGVGNIEFGLVTGGFERHHDLGAGTAHDGNLRTGPVAHHEVDGTIAKADDIDFWSGRCQHSVNGFNGSLEHLSSRFQGGVVVQANGQIGPAGGVVGHHLRGCGSSPEPSW